MKKRGWLMVLAAATAACGCKSGISGSPDVAMVDMAAPPVQKVDVLFMIDNSTSQPYQIELRKRFPGFVAALQDAATAGHPASYHIGVVTSDLGAGSNTTSCRAGGDGGRLQVAPQPNSAGVPPGCSGFSLGGGVRFVDYNQLDGTNNILGGADLPTAFNCMAAVGDQGCGFEHVLESVYKALHDPVPENAGFLRSDALLVVLFMTEEDDCSAPPDSDLFELSTANYGVLDSFRCTRYGITCDDPPRPLSDAQADAQLTNCRPLPMANGGKLYDVQRYIDFFTKPADQGGVKANPADVILAAISAPAEPFSFHMTMPCFDQVNTPSCAALRPSCIAATDPAFIGNPAVRLSAVVNAARNRQLDSVCDTDYSPAFDSLAHHILSRLP